MKFPLTTNRISKFKKAILVAFLALTLGINLQIPTVSAANPDPGANPPAETPLTCPTGSTKSQTGNYCVDNTDNTKIICPSGYRGTGNPITNCVLDTSVGEAATNPLLEQNANTEKLRENLVWLETIRSTLNFIIWPIIFLIGQLLDNSLLFGNGMEERLLAIWRVVRNLVNLIFVVVIVGVALYNVLGLGDDNGNYSLKSILPKIIIGIIAVNFSFVVMKVMLDGINVLTTAVFSLPQQLGQNLSIDGTVEEKICKAVGAGSAVDQDDHIARSIAQSAGIKVTSTDTYQTIISKIDADTIIGNNGKDALKNSINSSIANKLCINGKISEVGKQWLSKYDSNNAAFVMATQLSGVLQLSEVDSNSLTVGKLVVNTLTSIILYIIYMAAFIALFVILLGRLVILWIAAAFSPFLLLAMAVPAIREKVSFLNDATDKIVQNAIAPLIIGVAMTIGFLMLEALKNVTSMDSIGGLKTAIIPSIPVAGIGSIQELLISICTIAVIWIAVFGAAKNTIAAGIVESIKGGLLGAAKFTIGKPLMELPLIPTNIKDSKGNSVAGIGELASMMRNIGNQRMIPDSDRFSDAMKLGNNNVVNSIKELGKLQVNDTTQLITALKSDRVQESLRSGKKEHISDLKEFATKNEKILRDSKNIELSNKIQQFIKEDDEKRRADIGKEINSIVDRRHSEIQQSQTPTPEPPKPQTQAPPNLRKQFGNGDKFLGNDEIKSNEVGALNENLEKLNTALTSSDSNATNSNLKALINGLGVKPDQNDQDIINELGKYLDITTPERKKLLEQELKKVRGPKTASAPQNPEIPIQTANISQIPGTAVPPIEAEIELQKEEPPNQPPEDRTT